jgi:hypothetical protein
MTPTNRATEKTFDCLEFKRKAQERIYEETKHLTTEEQIEYFKQTARSGTLGQWWHSITEGQAQRQKSTQSP